MASGDRCRGRGRRSIRRLEGAAHARDERARCLPRAEAPMRPDVHDHELGAVLRPDASARSRPSRSTSPRNRRCRRKIDQIWRMDGDVVDARGLKPRPELSEPSAGCSPATPRCRVVREDLDCRRADLLGAIRGLEHTLTQGQVGADQSAVGGVRHSAPMLCAPPRFRRTASNLALLSRFDGHQSRATVRSVIDPQLLTALKALSDASRLRIVGLLAEGRSMTVEQLGRRLADAGDGRAPHEEAARGWTCRIEATTAVRRLFAAHRPAGQIGGELHRLGREQAGDAIEPMDKPAWASAEEAARCAPSSMAIASSSIPAQHGKRLDGPALPR